MPFSTDSVQSAVVKWSETNSQLMFQINAPVAQQEEQQTLDLEVEGSIPDTPINVRVAELAYALDLKSIFYGFESHHGHQQPYISFADSSERRTYIDAGLAQVWKST